MSHSQNDRPTDPTERPDPYYQYRVTLPHARVDELLDLIKHYSFDWCLAAHFPDEFEDGCKQEHFHAVFRDFDTKKVDSFKKAVSKKFEKAGNALHAGKFQDNHISKAIGYFKHDEHADIRHSGQPYWDEYIQTEPAFVKSKSRKVLKETQSHPVLTYANVLKQALKYRHEHALRTDSLSDVVEEMVNTHNWWPSRELLVNGIPSETHQRFSDLCQSKRTKLSFWLPHERSEKKQEWIDRVCVSTYQITSSGPSDSKRLWKDKDFRDPSSI